jgi:hypothetical protein
VAVWSINSVSCNFACTEKDRQIEDGHSNENEKKWAEQTDKSETTHRQTQTHAQHVPLLLDLLSLVPYNSLTALSVAPSLRQSATLALLSHCVNEKFHFSLWIIQTHCKKRNRGKKSMRSDRKTVRKTARSKRASEQERESRQTDRQTK